jgi:hypothetical protein
MEANIFSLKHSDLRNAHFQYLTTELELAREFQDQRKKCCFLYFHVFLCGNEFLRPKKEKKSLNRAENLFSSNGAIWIYMQNPEFNADCLRDKNASNKGLA